MTKAELIERNERRTEKNFEEYKKKLEKEKRDNPEEFKKRGELGKKIRIQ